VHYVTCASDVTRIGIRELAARLGVDRSTIWRWYRSGRFPLPHFVGERRAWFRSEVEAWECSQMAIPAEMRRSSRNADRLRQRRTEASVDPVLKSG
jgi:excisionase family DNA binding protein